MSAVIGVVAKAPEPGRVKTRLCPPLTTDEAAAVAVALLTDTVRNAVATGVPTWCVGTGDRATLERTLPVGVPVLEQRGSGLAARLAAAQADLFARGYDQVLLLAGDCPTVGPAYLAIALARLDGAEVVLGRVADGGYSLIATRAPTPELFDGVPMSTAHTLDATVAAARAAGLDTEVLPSRRDLDTPADFAGAAAEGQLDDAPATLAVLAALPALTGPSAHEARAAPHGPAGVRS